MARSVVDGRNRARSACHVCRDAEGRVQGSPAGARRFLETLAVCGRPMAPDLVYEAAVSPATSGRSSRCSVRTISFAQRLGPANRDLSRPDPRKAGGARVSRRDTRHPRPHGPGADRARRRRSRGALLALPRGRRSGGRLDPGGPGGDESRSRPRLRSGRVVLSQRPRAGAGFSRPHRVEARIGGVADQCRPTGGGRAGVSRGVGRRRRLAAGRSSASRRRTVPHRRPHRSGHGCHPHGASRLAHAAGAEPAGGVRFTVMAARPDPPARTRVRGTRPGSHAGGHVCCASIPAGR